MLFKVPIMLCSNSQHQANYAHCFVPISYALDFSQFLITFILISYLTMTLFHRKDEIASYSHTRLRYSLLNVRKALP